MKDNKGFRRKFSAEAFVSAVIFFNHIVGTVTVWLIPVTGHFVCLYTVSVAGAFEAGAVRGCIAVTKVAIFTGTTKTIIIFSGQLNYPHISTFILWEAFCQS